MFPPGSWPGSSVGLECQPVTLEVEGSSPFRVAILALVAQLVEHVTENHSVGGSIPPQGTSGSSSVGRAPPCQGGGRESEPRLPLHFLRRNSQAVRRRSAKPLFSSSILDCASICSGLKGFGGRARDVLGFFFLGCRKGLVKVLRMHEGGKTFISARQKLYGDTRFGAARDKSCFRSALGKGGARA